MTSPRPFYCRPGCTIMADIKNILRPTDFSEYAESALPFVTSLSEKYGAAVHIPYEPKEYLKFGAA
ncbi:MAG: hypothetical protein ACOC7W_09920 [Desulfosalsimonas sp.]